MLTLSTVYIACLIFNKIPSLLLGWFEHANHTDQVVKCGFLLYGSYTPDFIDSPTRNSSSLLLPIPADSLILTASEWTLYQ